MTGQIVHRYVLLWIAVVWLAVFAFGKYPLIEDESFRWYFSRGVTAANPFAFALYGWVAARRNERVDILGPLSVSFFMAIYPAYWWACLQFSDWLPSDALRPITWLDWAGSLAWGAGHLIIYIIVQLAVRSFYKSHRQ